MAHDNGAPAVRLYHHGSHFDDITAQGPIICFNVLRADGSYVGYSQVKHTSKLADLCTVYSHLFYEIKNAISVFGYVCVCLLTGGQVSPVCRHPPEDGLLL